jgi:hypothetical protein
MKAFAGNSAAFHRRGRRVEDLAPACLRHLPAPFGRSWVEQPEDMIDAPPMLEEHKPDRPPTTHWQYLPDRVYVNEPAPYATFDPGARF